MNLPVNPDITRFQKYVEKGEGECHRWKGGKDIKGYGIFFFKGKTWFAHRASLILYDRIKSLNPALQIRHSCKNKDCVNPDHLSEGTREENCADKRRDGTNLSGDKCHFSKLNWEKVSEIRNKSETTSRKALAQEYKVSLSAISSIINRNSWII